MTDPQRVAIIGDVHGHYDPLVGCLERLGVDVPRKRWPDDLTVVQVGDLIHRGPESDATVALADTLMAWGRWVQLAGNHEGQYLGGPEFWPHDELLSLTVETLHRWHAYRHLRVAVALNTDEHGDVIVTHAGITHGWWHDALDAPDGAAQVAAATNRLLTTDPPTAFTAGTMLYGVPSADAGPAWAHPLREVAPSWRDHPDGMPWTQIHGHLRPQVRGRRGGWFVPHHRDAHADEHHTHIPTDGGRWLIGVDPGFGRRTTRPLLPLILHGHLLNAGGEDGR